MSGILSINGKSCDINNVGTLNHQFLIPFNDKLYKGVAFTRIHDVEFDLDSLVNEYAWRLVTLCCLI